MAKTLIKITEKDGSTRVVVFFLAGKLLDTGAFDVCIQRYSGTPEQFNTEGVTGLRCQQVLNDSVVSGHDLNTVGSHYQAYVNTMLRRRNGVILEQDGASRKIMEHTWDKPEVKSL